MKRWWILGLLATIFSVVGAVVAVLLGQQDPEIQKPVNEVLEETGWKASWWGSLSAEAKGGLVMGVIGGVGGLAAVVVAVVQALV